MEKEKKLQKRENLDKTAVISKVKLVHLAILDNYFINGYNGTKAVQSVFPEMGDSSASAMASKLLKMRANKEYIRLKQIEIQEAAQITPQEIAKELKTLAFSNLVDFIGLTEQQLKELPESSQRALAKYTLKEKITTLPDGTEIRDITRVYQLKNTLDALEKLARHTGFYEIDNRQKANQVNILNNLAESSPETLNKIEQAMRTIPIDT